MFETGIVKKSGDLKKDHETLYTEWQGRLHRTRNFQNDEFIITLSESKRGAHHIDLEKHIMRGYQLHIVFPGQRSHFSILDYTFTYQLRIAKINFEKVCTALRFSLHLYRIHPVQNLTQSEFEKLRDELRNIGDELRMDRPLLEIICSRARVTLQEISRILEKRISDINLFRIPSVLFEFLQLVKLHYNKEHNVTFYAKKLNVSSGYLAILTRNHLNITPKKVIKGEILTESKRLLSLVPITIKAVMYQLGFEDQAVFTQFFKSSTGMSPTEFQKSTITF